MQRNLHDSHILCPSNKCINLQPSGFSILKIKKSWIFFFAEDASSDTFKAMI